MTSFSDRSVILFLSDMEAFVLDLMTRHPKSVGESYGEHLGVAWSFGMEMIGSGLACLLHGLLPFMFERTGSRSVEKLHARMRRRGIPNPSAGDATVR
jgi:hypothetical protein